MEFNVKNMDPDRLLNRLERSLELLEADYSRTQAATAIPPNSVRCFDSLRACCNEGSEMEVRA